ncbi:hypothetical protein [Pseudovibrio ascidiaceicola]|uniref:hypothetical protein n=1 Tax=Pseudovibrio ascidiaceicola TaxID=285279 RepID=UPI000B80850A|nr:hypothetical protein [Pseudovibrio ascidiaceicola]
MPDKRSADPVSSAKGAGVGEGSSGFRIKCGKTKDRAGKWGSRSRIALRLCEMAVVGSHQRILAATPSYHPATFR